MFPIAGQTAAPIGLKKFQNFFLFRKLFLKIFFPRATPGPSASFGYF